MKAFIDTYMGVQKRIDHSLSSECAQQVERNRTVLKSTISCFEFCGRQGIALRGHRDDATVATEHSNKALIQLRIDAGDSALESHLSSCSKRATYMSKTSQN